MTAFLGFGIVMLINTLAAIFSYQAAKREVKRMEEEDGDVY